MSDTTSQPSSSFPPSSPSATPVNQSTTAQANEATRMAAIIGGTVGGLLLLAIVVAAIVVPRQRRRKAAKEIRKRQMVDFDPPFWDGNAGVGSGKLGGDKEDRHGSGNSDNGSGNGNGNRNMNSSWKKKKEYPVNDGTFGTRGGRNHRSTESDLVGMLPLLGMFFGSLVLLRVCRVVPCCWSCYNLHLHPHLHLHQHRNWH
ncbi:hypothetical protein FA15DRAFT_668614 [Coprinopsis marcescibilis]|uniref:Uncharacterized protein n=1 Tax=Coprinopsis marcescibilis TaxID=230819 RepID=A0A5C3KYW8_COPMA|nr:hypothetical protein FA15DRAFT_668614 [Coprinopsis marcescibilis]